VQYDTGLDWTGLDCTTLEYCRGLLCSTLLYFALSVACLYLHISRLSVLCLDLLCSALQDTHCLVPDCATSNNYNNQPTSFSPLLFLLTLYQTSPSSLLASHLSPLLACLPACLLACSNTECRRRPPLHQWRPARRLQCVHNPPHSSTPATDYSTDTAPAAPEPLPPHTFSLTTLELARARSGVDSVRPSRQSRRRAEHCLPTNPLHAHQRIPLRIHRGASDRATTTTAVTREASIGRGQQESRHSSTKHARASGSKQ